MISESFTFKRIQDAQIREVFTWRYEPPYDVYNINPENAESEIAFFLDPKNNYYSIYNSQGEMIAFCTFGDDAQVPTGDYSQPALDIGLGVRPDLTGKGMGNTIVKSVLDFAEKTFSPPRTRVTIAKFNLRAQKVWKNFDFVQTQEFTFRKNNRDFIVMTRE